GASARAATQPQVIVITPSSWRTDLIMQMRCPRRRRVTMEESPLRRGGGAALEGAGGYFLPRQPFSPPPLFSPPFLACLPPLSPLQPFSPPQLFSPPFLPALSPLAALGASPAWAAMVMPPRAREPSRAPIIFLFIMSSSPWGRGSAGNGGDPGLDCSLGCS